MASITQRESSRPPTSATKETTKLEVEILGLLQKRELGFSAIPIPKTRNRGIAENL
jgi:hypothetical protein